ncbi:hypothetical protein SAMN04487948_105156 [Halogranum amylolyticum]|uniref:Uncharacterized protein n=1 Tax=Halogranum amylolyticum TaxID=660520 RepID=A0A1H8SKZ0_9EURY|nr:hypothetical protein [Halogranum amylolyticum]SEO79024.1 hypothetical protein SAMN04487948_105156 [Halogranum amylolyticum]
MGPIRTFLAFLGLAFYLAAVATGLYALTLVWSVVQSSGGAGALEVAASIGVTVLFLFIGRALSQRGKGVLGYGGG